MSGMNNQTYMLCVWHVIAGFFGPTVFNFFGLHIGVCRSVRVAGTALGYSLGGDPACSQHLLVEPVPQVSNFII